MPEEIKEGVYCRVIPHEHLARITHNELCTVIELAPPLVNALFNIAFDSDVWIVEFDNESIGPGGIPAFCLEPLPKPKLPEISVDRELELTT